MSCVIISVLAGWVCSTSFLWLRATFGLLTRWHVIANTLAASRLVRLISVVSGRVGGVWLFSVGWGHTVEASILALDEIERDGSGKSDGVDEGWGDD